MTLSGTGDLILHEGTLQIQPSPRHGLPSSTTTSSRRATALWGEETPPRALGVSGGSLGIFGGGAEISSTRANAPALSISVGLPDTVVGTGEGQEGASSPSAIKSVLGEDETRFSYSGVALSVNVLEAGDGRSPDRFKLLELSVGGGEGKAREEGRGDWTGGEGRGGALSLLSVRGDGRVSMAGGGGVVLEEGDLTVLQGDAKFQVKRKGHYPPSLFCFPFYGLTSFKPPAINILFFGRTVTRTLRTCVLYRVFID